MSKLIRSILPILALCALVSCSDDAASSSSSGEQSVKPDAAKELIAFSGDGNGFTRASMTRGGFAGNTKVVIRIKADATGQPSRYTQSILTAGAEIEKDAHNTDYKLVGPHSDLSYVTDKQRYWDDAYGRDSKLTVYAVAVPNKNDNTIADTFLDQTGGTVIDADNNPNWYTIGTENTKVSWTVSDKQTADSRLAEDIAYSNNIKEGESSSLGRYVQTYDVTNSIWNKSMGYGRLQWEAEETGSTFGKFDQGHLVFKHALSWITIVLKEGNGFDHTSAADFAWTNQPTGCSQTITLKGFPTSGKLDVSTGAWSDATSTDIRQMDETTGTPANQTTRTLHVYVLPGTNLATTTTNVIEFEIDNAQYYVTGAQIAQAVQSYYATGGAGASDANASTYQNFTTTEAGKHYFINLTVGQKSIDNVTAAILDWEGVNSTDIVPDNTYATFSFEDRHTQLVGDNASQFNIYRAAKTTTDYITGTTTANYDWTSGYDAAATKTWNGDHWEATDWFWPNNKTYYHFRAAGKGESATATDADVTIATDATGGDNFAIYSGTVAGSDYRDYVWGAPFTYVDNSYKMKYTPANGLAMKEDGTTYQISPAIAATKSQIKMLLFHMTSQIVVNLKTVTGEDKVTLTDGTNLAKVEILNILPEGKVLMGTGAVSASGTRKDGTMASSSAAASQPATTTSLDGYTYGVVPQDLIWSTPSAGVIGLRITTPDGNQYLVANLSESYAEVSTTNLLNPYTVNKEGSSTLWKIDKWYPHYKYTYTITLKQTGISNITAAVLPWETVTGDIGTIDLEY